MTETIDLNQVSTPNTPNKSKKSMLIGLIVFFLLASGVSVYGYTTQGWFKSAKQLYLESEAKNSQSLFEDLDTSFKKIDEDYKPFLENPVHIKQDITANITTGSSQLDPQTQLILGILQRSKVTLDYSQDPKTKQSVASIDLSVNGAAPMTLQGFQDNEQEGFSIPTLYNKFLIASYKDTETIKKNLGIEAIPQKVTTSADLLNAVKTSKAELAPIYEPYAKIYADAIQKDQVKAVSDEISVGEAHFKGKTYTVTFNEAQAKALVNSLADQLSSDDQLLDLLYSKYSNLMTLAQSSGLKVENVKTKDDLKKSIQDYAKELKTNAEKLKPLTMVVKVDENNKILERTVKESDTNNTYRIANWTADNQTNFVIDFQGTDAEGNKSFKYAYTIKPVDGKQQKGTLALTMKETGSNSSDLSLDTDFTVTKDNNNTNHVVNFKLSSNDSQGNTQLTGSVTNEQALENNGSSQTFKTGVKINLDSPSFGLKGAVLNLNTTGKYEFGTPINLPKLNSENSLDLGKATQSDINQYNLQLQQGLGSYLQREPALLQIFLPFLMGSM